MSRGGAPRASSSQKPLCPSQLSLGVELNSALNVCRRACKGFEEAGRRGSVPSRRDTGVWVGRTASHGGGNKARGAEQGVLTRGRLTTAGRQRGCPALWESPAEASGRGWQGNGRCCLFRRRESRTLQPGRGEQGPGTLRFSPAPPHQMGPLATHPTSSDVVLVCPKCQSLEAAVSLARSPITFSTRQPPVIVTIGAKPRLLEIHETWNPPSRDILHNAPSIILK